nr:hypothetical protein [Angustibacter aerolatus]
MQVRQAGDQGLDSLRQSDLVRILDDVGDRRDRLAAEASEPAEPAHRACRTTPARRPRSRPPASGSTRCRCWPARRPPRGQGCRCS